MLLEAEFGRPRAVLEWADWTESAAEIFGDQKARLQRRGEVIEDMDIAIGAVGLSLGATLATCNVAHMSRLEGLVVDDWGA